MTRDLGPTPLSAIDAVALDTETTGSDARRDRIIQLAGVVLGHERLGSSFDMLINPGIPISPGAIAIHHISDEMVRDKSPFETVWPVFRQFAGDRLLIGHSIGFDLAIISAEARRAGIPWQRPRSLCLRMLARATNLCTPECSLEALAKWAGVSIEGRHSALGDARIAAEVFVALVPHLSKYGIRTLAEAERAIIGMADQLDLHHRAGWVEPVMRPDPARSFASLDPFAYQHRVRNLMSTPPTIARGNMPAKDAIAVMLERKIGSLLVSQDGAEGGRISNYSIVTERDLMRHISARGSDGLDDPIDHLSTKPLISVRSEAFAYRAVGRMARLRIRHLAVRNEEGRLAGMISARDLLQLRATAAINLDDAIEAASTTAELQSAWASVPAVTKALIAEKVESPSIAEIVSEELRAMTRQCARIAEGEMIAKGCGPAPSAYAILVLGSGGRGESLLAPDQDNALVYASPTLPETGDSWFAEFAERFNTLLDTAGIPLCTGGVMARNPLWRGSLETWTTRIDEWVRRSNPDDLLNVDIFFDMRPVHGDHALAATLHLHAIEAAHREIPFLKGLAARAAVSTNSFTFMGNFRTENGRIDLKRHGLFPLVAFARTLAIRYAIPEVSTRRRLDELVTQGIGSKHEFSGLATAHATILNALLQQQSHDLLSGIPVSNCVDPSFLSSEDRKRLKSALKTVELVPEILRSLMFR